MLSPGALLQENSCSEACMLHVCVTPCGPPALWCRPCTPDQLAKARCCAAHLARKEAQRLQQRQDGVRNTPLGCHVARAKLSRKPASAPGGGEGGAQRWEQSRVGVRERRAGCKQAPGGTLHAPGALAAPPHLIPPSPPFSDVLNPEGAFEHLEAQ